MTPNSCCLASASSSKLRIPVQPGHAFHGKLQVLFGENSIPLKEATAEKRRERVHEKVQQTEHEAREKRAAEQDEMYGDHMD